ncbi:unnamed protein product [Oikopleura dioica]|uniref:Amino acid permease/ SLC12A domain-containing protein n=2 Tax=Oikopleura dioica TaxID=34765 RepID=E4Z301_OIKDI|nr:unnamed protein product [Oikopleura dioica]
MSGKIQLQRHVDLTSAVMIIVGAIVGSGIYISPKGILEHAGTSGYALILWILSGLVASMGAFCYAEAGALIPKSGGEYPVILEAFGPICGFTFAWTCTTIIRPASLAIFTSAFAQYAFSIISDCGDTVVSQKLLACAAIWSVCAINVYSMNLTQSLTKIFGYIKIASLVIIILLGVYGLVIGKGDLSVWQVDRAFLKDGKTAFPDVSHIGLGLYHGLWSYDGWNQLNYVVEEMKNPETNLLKAIVISLIAITGFYLVINFMYISILGVENILASPAVATSYAQKIFPQISFIIPVMVACSCLGAALVQGMTAARIPYSAAREGQMPVFLSMIHIDFLTPAPAVMLKWNSCFSASFVWRYQLADQLLFLLHVDFSFLDLFRHFHLPKNASDGQSRAFIRRSSLHSRCYNSDWFLSVSLRRLSTSSKLAKTSILAICLSFAGLRSVLDCFSPFENRRI